jgi:hypothetical protein
MYVVYNVNTKLIVKSYKTEHGANIGKTAKVKRDIRQACRISNMKVGEYAVVSKEFYDANIRTTKVVRSFMTGTEIEIDINTPLCCDPSSETYWSM